MIPAEELRAVARALLNTPNRLIGVRAAGAFEEAPCVWVADRSVQGLAYALEEAAVIYPTANEWEIIAADDEIERPPVAALLGSTPEAVLPPLGRVFRKPVVVATFRTGPASHTPGDEAVTVEDLRRPPELRFRN